MTSDKIEETAHEKDKETLTSGYSLAFVKVWHKLILEDTSDGCLSVWILVSSPPSSRNQGKGMLEVP